MPGDPLSRPLIEIARDLREKRVTALRRQLGVITGKPHMVEWRLAAPAITATGAHPSRRCWCREITARAACTRDAGCRAP
jgi:hypothetical protein